MRQNTTLLRLRSGQPALGVWSQAHRFHTARIIAANGIVDWIAVDLSTAASIFAAVADVSGGACTPSAAAERQRAVIAASGERCETNENQNIIQ
jgi:2-keto-3-deoxy-L-rhamnonate aldolase RhmA